METKITYDEAYWFVSEGRLGDLFKKLLAQMKIFNGNTNFIENDESLQHLRDALHLRSGQRKDLERKYSLGTCPPSDYSIQSLEITNAVLFIVNQLPPAFWREEQLDSDSKAKTLADIALLNSDGVKRHGVENHISLKLTKNGKDRSVYNFMGIPYNKGRLVNAVIREYVRLNPNLTYADLEKAFPKKIQGSYGVFATKEDAENEYAEAKLKNYDKAKKRYNFTNSYDWIQLGNVSIVTSIDWGILNIPKFIDKANSLNSNFKIVKF
jgi:hypothetical protein